MSERQWYYLKDSRQCGPVDESKLIDMFGDGRLRPQTQVWSDPMEKWQAAFSTKSFAGMFETEIFTPTTYKARPTSLKVLGILNIIFGSLGVICTPIVLLLSSGENTAWDPSKEIMGWVIVTNIIGFFCSLVLIFLGIGLLQLKAWAREWTYYYGLIIIGWNVVVSITNLALIITGEFGYTKEALPGAIAGTIGGLIGSLIYPTVLVVFMRKPEIIDACEQSEESKGPYHNYYLGPDDESFGS